MKKALLVIDFQIMPFVWKDYGGKELYRSRELLGTVAELIGKARAADVPIYYFLHTETGESPRVEGSPLWQIHPEVAPLAHDHRIVKYHPDIFHGTELDRTLKQNRICNLVLCGIQTEYCVDTACRSAYFHGYETEVAMDGHSTFDSDELTAEQIICHHNTVLKAFAEIKQSGEIFF